MSFLNHARAIPDRRVSLKKKEVDACRCVSTGEAVSIADHIELQRQLDVEMLARRDLKVNILISLGIIDSEDQVLNITDSEIIDMIVLAAC